VAITIETEDLEEIKSALGYPLVSQLDWGTGTDDYIKNYIVKRVLRTYYTYFPMKVDTTHSVSGSIEIDYPTDTYVFRKLRHFFNYKQINYNTMSPFTLQTLILQRGRSIPSEIGQREMNEVINRISTAESLIDYTQAFMLEDYPEERKLKGSTSISGTLTVQWAKRSDSFSSIYYNHKEDAILLGKAYLLQESARLRSQAQIQTKVSIDVSRMAEDGQRWEQEINQKWKSRGFAVLAK